MAKTEYLLVFTTFIIVLFFSETTVNADFIADPIETGYGLGYLIMTIIYIIIVVIGLIAWFIIRSVRRKKDGHNN